MHCGIYDDYDDLELQVIHEDALSRADTTKRTVRRNYLNRCVTTLGQAVSKYHLTLLLLFFFQFSCQE